MPAYDREYYSRTFARLLNTAMQKGQGDARQALAWLDKRYKPLLALLFTRHKLETSDAYMDAREHITKRIENESKTGKKSELKID
jgi:hypothetical protein